MDAFKISNEHLPEGFSLDTIRPDELRFPDKHDELEAMVALCMLDIVTRKQKNMPLSFKVPKVPGTSEEEVMREIFRNVLMLKGRDQRRYSDALYIIARDKNGAVVGMRLFSRSEDKDCAMLNSLMVHPDYRGMGLGTRIAEASIALAKHRRFNRIRLQTDGATSEEAAKIREKQGFTEVGKITFPNDPEGLRTIYTWEKTLS